MFGDGGGSIGHEPPPAFHDALAALSWRRQRVNQS
jgi:hypothetical protein